MLVVSFQVDRRGPGQLRTVLQHCEMRTSGIEPHVEDVGLFSELPAAALAAEVRSKEIARRMLVPRICSLASKKLRHFGEECRAGDRLIALVAIQHGDRHAP